MIDGPNEIVEIRLYQAVNVISAESVAILPESLCVRPGEKRTEIITDASPVGLGAVLLQEWKGENPVISYASRGLSDLERRYSQTGKEALGVPWACERFHVYLYGVDFELWKDPKALEFIYSARSRLYARIEK